MSRIGRMPVAIPAGVDVKLDGAVLTVKGPKGTLTQEFNHEMIIKVEGGRILVERPSEEKRHKALHGLTRSLIANMVTGVTEGYKKELEINGVGYKAAVKGKVVELNLGFSHPINHELPAGVEASVEKNQIILKSADKQVIGQVAAQIRGYRPPEPYKGKGVKYAEERIIRKAGKTSKK